MNQSRHKLWYCDFSANRLFFALCARGDYCVHTMPMMFHLLLTIDNINENNWQLNKWQPSIWILGIVDVFICRKITCVYDFYWNYNVTVTIIFSFNWINESKSLRSYERTHFSMCQMYPFISIVYFRKLPATFCGFLFFPFDRHLLQRRIVFQTIISRDAIEFGWVIFYGCWSRNFTDAKHTRAQHYAFAMEIVIVRLVHLW